MVNAIIGFLSGITASMGLGGGFVLMIWLTLFSDTAQKAAQGINLLFFLPIALISVIMHSRAGLINKKLVLCMIPGGVIGAILGAMGSQAIENELLRKLYAVFLLAFGIKEGIGRRGRVFRRDKRL